jgi:hypothetical protein
VPLLGDSVEKVPSGDVAQNHLIESTSEVDRCKPRNCIWSDLHFAVVLNPANGGTEAILRDVREAAPTIGLQIRILNASTIGEIDAALSPSRASASMPSSSLLTRFSRAAKCSLSP